MQISDMIPGVNIIGGKVIVASIIGAGGSGGGGFWDPSGVFRGWRSLRKFLGSKEHRDRLKTDLNAAEIITVQDYKHKKTNVNGSTYIKC